MRLRGHKSRNTSMYYLCHIYAVLITPPIQLYTQIQIHVFYPKGQFDLPCKDNFYGSQIIRTPEMQRKFVLNDKLVYTRQNWTEMKLNTSLNDLAVKLRIHGRHPMLSYLSSLPIAVLRSLDTEANRFYDRNHRMYDAALLTRCYTQHALRPFIDSESNHIRSFIKIPFINKGIDFIDLTSIFQDKSVIQSLCISEIQNLLLFVTNIINQSEILFLISINLFLILIFMLILQSLEIVKILNVFINQPDI